MQTVGAVAARAGLTVRTLHHYDQIGLVSPSARSDAGYRLYAEEEIRRLERVLTFRQLGFSLEQIGRLLDDPAWTLGRVLRTRLEALDGEIAELTSLRLRLAALVERVEQGGGAVEHSADTALELVSAMDRVRSHYTPGQLEEMSDRARELGPEAIRAAEDRWPQLIEEVRRHVVRQTDPADPRVQALAAEWRGLIAAFTGGDPAVEERLREAYASEPEMAQASGIDPAVQALVRAALAVSE